MISEIFSRIDSESPSDSSVGVLRDLSIRRITTCSPSTVGSTATRMSSMRPTARALSEMRPSCGLRRSAMSSFASTFRRVVTPFAIRFGIRCTSFEHAVDAHPHEQRVLLRLEVDVARAVGGGLHDDRVDEPDERSVRDAVVDLEIVLVLVDDLEVVERRLRLHDLALARAPLELGEDLVAARDTRDRPGTRVASRSSSIPWMFAGIGDRDAEPLVDARDRNRDDALERPQRHELGRIGRDALLLQDR